MKLVRQLFMPALAAGLAASPARADEGFFSVKDRAWAMRFDYSGPRASFDEEFRDIGLSTLEVQRAWTFHGPFELRAGGGLTYAKGSTSEPLAATPRNNVDVLGLNAGVEARIDVARLKDVRLFVDGSVNMLWTHGKQFPPGGSGANGYVRAGPGVMVRLNDKLALEGGYHLSHVSNGAGLVAHNPAFNGKGPFLALRIR